MAYAVDSCPSGPGEHLRTLLVALRLIQHRPRNIITRRCYMSMCQSPSAYLFFSRVPPFKVLIT